MRRARLAIAGGLVALQLLSCGGGGGGPVDPCPTGDCTVSGATIVKFLFDSYPEWKFVGDTCIDMNVFTVRAVAVHIDDRSIIETRDVQCGEGQVTFLGLSPGTYDVAVTPLDGGGNAVVSAPGTGQVAAAEAGGRIETTVNVPYTAWLGSFTGTLLFRLTWAGKSCELATPAVATQTLELTAGGVVVGRVSDSGQRMDGTDPQPCRPLSEPFSQFVESLPFGPAALSIVGHDADGQPRFVYRFETFIGAGKNNPTFTYDVPAPDAGVDAGIDAMPDATPDGSIDGMPVPDAAIDGMPAPDSSIDGMPAPDGAMPAPDAAMPAPDDGMPAPDGAMPAPDAAIDAMPAPDAAAGAPPGPL